MMQKILVDLSERGYPIYIESGLLSQIKQTSSLVVPYVAGNNVLIVSNTTIAPLYLSHAQQVFSNYSVDVVILQDGEQYKNLTALDQIFTTLLEHRHGRDTTLVALGGGVIGDMTGFAAACYQRGVKFIQIPTTLLAQVDSSVGGKTGVNHVLGKNMVGAFHQPACVLIDTDTLSTLPAREFSAGLAEVIKYGLISDADFFNWLESNLDAVLARNADALGYAISVSCRNKASIVARDEKENDIRAILNLGHTFGHAIEAWQHYTGLLHGEAVAVGMLMAIDMSVRQQWISSDVFDRTRALLQRAGLPLTIPGGITVGDFMKYMAVDKKVLSGVMRLVLLKNIGEAVVTSDYKLTNLESTLQYFCNAD